eukprot:768166-Hanusia_phi.AAC.7
MEARFFSPSGCWEERRQEPRLRQKPVLRWKKPQKSFRSDLADLVPALRTRAVMVCGIGSNRNYGSDAIGRQLEAHELRAVTMFAAVCQHDAGERQDGHSRKP